MLKSILHLALLFLALEAWSAPAKTPLQLALNWKAEPQFGGFYAAADEFAKRGLNVQVLEGGSGTPTVQMLAHGKVEYAVVGAEEIILSNERNPETKVKAIFASYQIAPHILMTHPERGFKTMKDIFSQPGTLAVQAGLPFFLFLQQKFGKGAVKIVPYAGGVSTFLSDPNFSQQGFETSEPLLVKKAGKKAQVFRVADEGFNPYTTVLAVRESYLKDHIDEVGQVVAAVREGWKKYLLDPALTNQRMGQINKSMDAETFAESAKAQKELIQPTASFKVGQMSDKRWQELVDQMLKIGLIKTKPLPSDVYKNLD